MSESRCPDHVRDAAGAMYCWKCWVKRTRRALPQELPPEDPSRLKREVGVVNESFSWEEGRKEVLAYLGGPDPEEILSPAWVRDLPELGARVFGFPPSREGDREAFSDLWNEISPDYALEEALGLYPKRVPVDPDDAYEEIFRFTEDFSSLWRERESPDWAPELPNHLRKPGPELVPADPLKYVLPLYDGDPPPDGREP